MTAIVIGDDIMNRVVIRNSNGRYYTVGRETIGQPRSDDELVGISDEGAELINDWIMDRLYELAHEHRARERE